MIQESLAPPVGGPKVPPALAWASDMGGQTGRCDQ